MEDQGEKAMQFTQDQVTTLTAIRDVLEEIQNLQDSIVEQIEDPKTYLSTLREIRDTLEEIQCMSDNLED